MVRRVGKFMHTLLRCRRWIVAVIQAWLVFCSLVVACLLQFEFRLPPVSLLLILVPFFIVVRIAVMRCFNLMHGWWRYTGVSDAIDVLKAVVTGSFVLFVAVRFAFRITTLPFSIYVLEALLSFVTLAGVRLLSRILAERTIQQTATKRLLIIGAGHAAQMIVRETQHAATGYSTVGCLDDDPAKNGLRILGVPILGTVDQVSGVVAEHEIDEIIIAIPSSTSDQMRRFVDACKNANVPFRTVPGLTELIAGQVTLRAVRDICLEDLLGREPVDLDLTSVRNQIQGRVVMVTGAAGSIGSELCRQVLRYAPALLVCVDQNEGGLFQLQQEFLLHSKEKQPTFVVADVGDAERMRRVFLNHRIQIVFHAAAYKHVPMMEFNVEEAVTNNIFGLLALLNVSQDSGCESFVMISSDKAVNPTSVMGCTKRIGELILAAWPSAGLRCVSVRFGNVLGSSGSVVPVFQEQIRRGRPLTITHPEITRFFMTIPEAVSLVLQAFAVGEHGNIMVLDMGQAVSILELAKTLVRLSGKSADDVMIQFTGLRPGEKLFEELFYGDERVLHTSCDKVKCTESRILKWPEIKRHLDELRVTVSLGDAASIRKKLKDIVPQFISPELERRGAAEREISVATKRLAEQGGSLVFARNTQWVQLGDAGD